MTGDEESTEAMTRHKFSKELFTRRLGGEMPVIVAAAADADRKIAELRRAHR